MRPRLDVEHAVRVPNPRNRTEEKVASTIEENWLGIVPKRGERLPATPDHTQEDLEKSAKDSGRARRNPGGREGFVTSESA